MALLGQYDATARINEGAKLRGSNTVATLDENGRVAITGSGLGGSSSTPTMGATPFDLAKINLAIDAAPTAKDKMMIAQKAVGDLSAYDISKNAEAVSQANTKFGIAALEAKVEQEKLLDQQDPMFKGAYGAITLQAQEQLQSAKQQAMTFAKQLLGTDPVHASIMAQGNFLIQKAGQEASIMLNREGAAAAEAQARSDMTPQAVKDNFKIMFPEVVGMPDDKMLQYLSKHPNKEAVEVAQMAHDPEVIKTFLTGTDAQKTAVKTFLSNKAGADQELKIKTLAEVDEYQKFLYAPEKAIENLPYTVEQKAEALKRIKNLKLDPSGNKQELTLLSRNYADAAMKKVNTDNFYNVDTWTPASKAFLQTAPATAPLIAQVVARGERPTLDNLMKAMARLQSPQEIAAAREVFLQVGTAEATKVNRNSLWPTIDAVEFKTKLSRTVTHAVLNKGDPNVYLAAISNIWDPFAVALIDMDKYEAIPDITPVNKQEVTGKIRGSNK